MGKGGIVRDESAQRAAVARVEAALVGTRMRARRMDRVSHSRAAKAIANSCSTQSFRRLPSGDSVQSEVRCQKDARSPKRIPQDMSKSSQSPTRQKTVAIISKPDRPELSKVLPVLEKWLQAAQLRGGNGPGKRSLFFGIERDGAERIGGAVAASGSGARRRRYAAFGGARGGEGRNADSRHQPGHAWIPD